MDNIHELSSKSWSLQKYPLRDTLKLFDVNLAPITPPRIKNVDDDGRTEEDAPDNATTDDEDDRTDKKNNRLIHAAAYATSADNTTDVEHHDSENEPVDDTTEHNNQDLNEQTRIQSRKRARTMVDHIMRAMHKADVQLAVNTHVTAGSYISQTGTQQDHTSKKLPELE